MRAIVDRAPKGFGTEPTTFRYDVVFLKPPLTAKPRLDAVPTKEGVDRDLGGHRRPLLLEARRAGRPRAA